MDVAAAVARVRRERGLGMSEAINELIRAGLMQQRETREPFKQISHDLGRGMDLANIGDVNETLDGPPVAEADDARCQPVAVRR